MSPDPYNGSYDLANPQSFNRYGNDKRGEIAINGVRWPEER